MRERADLLSLPSAEEHHVYIWETALLRSVRCAAAKHVYEGFTFRDCLRRTVHNRHVDFFISTLNCMCVTVRQRGASGLPGRFKVIRLMQNR